jgi:hypothetical protein
MWAMWTWKQTWVPALAIVQNWTAADWMTALTLTGTIFNAYLISQRNLAIEKRTAELKTWIDVRLESFVSERICSARRGGPEC